MNLEKFVRRVSGAAVCAYVLSLSACCSTHSVMCLPEAKKRELGIPEKISFNLEAVKHVASTNIMAGALSDFGVTYLSDAELRAKLMQKAVEVYPKLFSDLPGAIPLDVTVTRTAKADLTGAGTCLSCLTLTIYPMPIRESVEFTVRVKSPNEDVNQRLAAPVTFIREDVGSESCFPTGWIPGFGGKGRRTWDSETSDKACEKLMLESCVNAIAAALQRVEPAAWEKK